MPIKSQPETPVTQPATPIPAPPPTDNNTNPLAMAPQYQMAPDMTPTPAEYERDAILAREEREAAIEKNRQIAEAAKNGKLPPTAQSLEEAREARAKAKKPDLQDTK